MNRKPSWWSTVHSGYNGTAECEAPGVVSEAPAGGEGGKTGVVEVNELAPARSRKRKGYLHLAMAALTCPCNGLIFLAIFGGTALGAFLNENLSLFLLGLTGIFLLTLFRGLRLIDAGEAKKKP